MAVQMVQGQEQFEFAAAQASAAGMPADCPLMARPGPEAGQFPKRSKGHTGCQACQLCMALAVQSVGTVRFSALATHPPVMPSIVRFSSAELARHTKPPIV